MDYGASGSCPHELETGPSRRDKAKGPGSRVGGNVRPAAPAARRSSNAVSGQTAGLQGRQMDSEALSEWATIRREIDKALHRSVR